ncbi:hypothetical protein RND71_004043 [Anisodus tanguticus]|uniref:Growth-regulating factor n=1 Tax=Anisodus tanguticus TaxID=243964 RepID=A0AAE1SYZ2_9SOLA|nr:hypothetical protein RND71_004043 [Anisodus tanguticus]
MDFNQSPAKLPRLQLDFHSDSTELPLFVSEPTTTTTTTKLLSDSTTTATTKFPRMGSGYFSLAQWQELELQALIFRHFVAGAPVPPELLHLVKKSIITTSPSYYISHQFQQYPHYQQAWYWGRTAMDPEPGRCRRTDGKKWRCSRDVVAGQKYCERHVHRGRSRSRKPVEIPTPVINGAKNNTAVSHQAFAKMAGHATTNFSLSGHSPSMDALHLNQRPSESTKKGPPLEAQKDGSGDGKSSSGQILRHFFDDWPRQQQQLQEGDNAATSLSISMPGGGNPSSDFSLKLSTGNDYDLGPQVSNVERSTWGTSHQVASMGGPLAEALRSSTTNSSPTSVLHRLA